jgi:hypothetical protein
VQSGIYDAATVVNADKTALFEKMPFPRVPAERAARRILDGVARNEAIVVFPFYARGLWWLGRLSPSVLRPFRRRMVSDFRTARVRPPAPAHAVSVVRNQGKTDRPSGEPLTGSPLPQWQVRVNQDVPGQAR